jgi:hypothetical protein
VIIVVIDQEHSLVIEKVDDDGREFVSAVGAATYTTRQALVKSNAWLFEWLWNETGLIEQQVQERIQIQRSALRSSAAWEITPANYKCAKCGKQVVREIRVYDPRMMPAQSAIVSAAMKRNNAGWIPFCFECISSHPYSRPSWLLSAVP